MLRTYCISIFLSLVVVSSATAGVVVEDGGTPPNVVYSNFNTSGDEAFHGLGGQFDLLETDRWYMRIANIPAGVDPPTIATFEFRGDNATTSSSNSMSWVRDYGGHEFEFTLDFSISGTDVLTNGSLEFTAANTTGGGVSVQDTLAVQVLNIFDYDVPNPIGFTDVDYDGSGNFRFQDSIEADTFATRSVLTGSGFSAAQSFARNIVLDTDHDPAVYPFFDPLSSQFSSLQDGIFVDSNGGYSWATTFSPTATEPGTSPPFGSGAVFNFGTSSFASFSAVPEPSSLMYATMVGLVAFGRRRRRTKK